MITRNQNGWKSRRLGDVLRIKHGYAFKGEFFAKEGNLVVLTPGNFRAEGGLKAEGEQKYYRGEFPDEFLLKRGELLVVMTDLTQNAPILGSPAFIPDDGKYLHNQRLGKVVDVKEGEIDRHFLFYLLNTREVRGQIKGSASGATVRHTSPDRIYEVLVHLPPVPVQRRIAGVLSAYDDLVGNSRWRIELLEEMARAIYWEWFVKFRALTVKLRKATPAEEKGTGKKEFPVGWELRSLGDVLELEYGKALKATDRIDGRVPVYGSSGIIGRHNVALVKAPGVVVGRKGNVGSVFWASEDFFPIDTVFYVKSSLSLHYLYFNLKEQSFLSGDVAVPGLNRGHAYRNAIVIPTPEDVRRFEDHVAPIFEKVRILEDVVGNLRRTRDWILPRLMSGDVSVEGVESETVTGRIQAVEEVSK